jgi:hypothetical protein
MFEHAITMRALTGDNSPQERAIRAILYQLDRQTITGAPMASPSADRDYDNMTKSAVDPQAKKAPTRATTLPVDPAERKRYPVASGVLDYFPDALVAIARVSQQGNDQHNPGQPLHWNRSKSTDESDTMIRHYLQRGTLDTDGLRHTAKMAWRALAILQKEIEADEAMWKNPHVGANGARYNPPNNPIESEPDYRQRLQQERSKIADAMSRIEDAEILRHRDPTQRLEGLTLGQYLPDGRYPTRGER